MENLRLDRPRCLRDESNTGRFDLFLPKAVTFASLTLAHTYTNCSMTYSIPCSASQSHLHLHVCHFFCSNSLTVFLLCCVIGVNSERRLFFPAYRFCIISGRLKEVLIGVQNIDRLYIFFQIFAAFFSMSSRFYVHSVMTTSSSTVLL